MLRLLAALFIWCSVASAQTPLTTTPPALQLSPQAAYDQAIAPVEITHRAIANWSYIEIAALGTAVHQASEACAQRASIAYTSDDLIAFAKLCALGQQWPASLKASTTYIGSPDPLKPQLARAYVYQVEADLNLRDEKAALEACLAMLKSVPYGPIADEVTTSALRYLQLAFTQDALELHSARQPFLLRMLRAPAPATATQAADSIPRPILFQHALDFAALELYDNHAYLATGILTDLNAATPSDLSPDDAIPIADARRQYALLGTHLPPISVSAALFSSTTPPRINPDFGASTVLLLSPPWCAQCLRQAQQIAPALSRLGSSKVRIYALLADDHLPTQQVPGTSQPSSAPASTRRTPQRNQPASPSAEKEPSTEQSAADQLLGTPTLVVAPATLSSFAASDFPFLIATDHDGIIRLILPAAPENGLVAGGAIDQLTAHILENWPLAPPH
ncbi:MAG: hypothetical protein JWM43_3285 [Acidobacteriaceae bacterium]|nr:hypothetical protein [Acidobacteriaceae bacterium]